MILFKNNGTPLFAGGIDVDDSSYAVQEVMGKVELNLSFSSPEALSIPVGTYCFFPQNANGSCAADGRRYELLSESKITERHSHNFEYTLVMEGEQSKCAYYKLFNIISNELKFDYTGRASEHIQLVVDNMNLRQPGTISWEDGHPVGPWKVGSVLTEATDVDKLVSYNHSSVLEALAAIASTYETEWEIVESEVSGSHIYTINLGKVEYYKASPLSLEYGRQGGVSAGLARTNASDSLQIGRLYVQGGDRNINLKTYGHKTLLLPKELTFGFDGEHFEWEDEYDSDKAVDMETDANGYFVELYGAPKNCAEDSLDCSEIYPKREGVISKVVESSVATGDGEPFIDIYDDSLIPIQQASNKPIFTVIEGNQFTIIFQGHDYSVSDTAGGLTGREIGVSGYQYSVVEGEEFCRFALAQETIDGQIMPTALSKAFSPKVGDTYAVFGCNMPEAYISDPTTHTGAEYEMLREAATYLYEHKDAKYTVSAAIDPIWAKRNWRVVDGPTTKGQKFVLGGYVTYKSEELFPSLPNNEYLTRIISVRRSVNSPYKVEITISNEEVRGTVAGTIKQIEDNQAHDDAQYNSAIAYSRRNFAQSKEMIAMLEGAFEGFTKGITPVYVNSMALLVGTETQQFKVYDDTLATEYAVFPFDLENFKISVPIGIRHYAIGVTGRGATDITTESAKGQEGYVSSFPHWSFEAMDEPFTVAHQGPDLVPISPEGAYYLYAMVLRTGEDDTPTYSGEWILSSVAIPYDSVEDYYYFLVGIVSSADENGQRSFASLYGYTEILPNQIRTGAVVSSDGNTFFNLDTGILSLNNQSGISGTAETGKELGQSIAAWFGGKRIDIEHLLAGQSADNAAKALLRFNGTGYLAKGAITWDENGYGAVGKDANGNALVAWGRDSGGNYFISLNSQFRIGNEETTLASILTALNTLGNRIGVFEGWFKEDSQGDIYLNKNGNTPRNFYSFGAVSAGGKQTGGGGGGGSYNDLTDQPKINGITLSGDKSASQLGLVASVAGKGLSTNDFTDAEKIKLSYLENNVFVGDGNTTFSEFWGAINGGLAVIKNSDDGETYFLTNTDAGEGGGLLFTRVTDRYIYWDLMYEDAPEESGEIGIQKELVSGTNIKTINGQSILGSGNITIGGGGTPTRLECSLITDGQTLYVAVPHGTILPSVTVEIARNIVSRSGKYYGHVSHKGWLSLTASGRNNPLVTFNQLMLRGVPEENYSDGKDAYPVLATGKRNGRYNDPTDISFNNLYQLAKTFATTGMGGSRGDGIRHGARRVKKAKWGIRLKSGSSYLTGWMPFHIVYVGGSELVSLTK